MEPGRAQHILKHVFGYDRFKGDQADVIDFPPPVGISTRASSSRR